MKKILLILGLISISLIIIGIFILGREDSTYSKKFSDTLFESYDDVDNKCSVDFIEFTIRGEAYAVYVYKTKGAILGADYPKFIDEWDYNPITDETIISKWQKCPLDTTSNKLLDISLNLGDFETKKCISRFKTELMNPENYYSYIYFREQENYFFLYCPNTEELYYIVMSL